MDRIGLNDVPYDLIISELEENISEIDKRKIRQWRELSRENEEAYHNILAVFREMELLPEYQKLDIETSWYDFRQKLTATSLSTSAPGKTLETRSTKVRNLKRYISIAASLLLITGLSFLFFKQGDIVEIATGVSQQKKITMPDGSEILLNQNTKFAYSPKNYEQNRTITLLKGEAYFNVIHNDRHPFKINISHFEIKDIGTSFNVRYEDKSVYVTVNTGEVSVSNGKNIVRLTANQKGICNLNSPQIISRTNGEANYKAWTDHNFQFINTSVSDVIQKLTEVYGTHIVIADSPIADKKMTIAFHNQNVDSVMNTIAQTMQLKLEKKAGVFYLKVESR